MTATTKIEFVETIYIQHHRYKYKTARCCKDYISISFRNRHGIEHTVNVKSLPGGQIEISKQEINF